MASQALLSVGAAGKAKGAPGAGRVTRDPPPSGQRRSGGLPSTQLPPPPSSARVPPLPWVESLGTGLGYDAAASLGQDELHMIAEQEEHWAQELMRRSASSAAILLDARTSRRR